MNSFALDILPKNEEGRLEALRRLGIMHSGRSAEFDAVVRLAAALFDCPIALVTLVDENSQWFKARCGLDVDGTAREQAFCRYSILGPELLVVPDALADERFSRNPLVLGSPGIRFYAGCPLSVDGEHMLGSLCVIDTRPREPSPAQLAQLRDLGTAVEGLIRAHSVSAEATWLREETERQRALVESQSELIAQTSSIAGVGGWEIDLESGRLFWTEQTRDLYEVGADYEPELESAIGFFGEDARPTLLAAIETIRRDAIPYSLELPLVTARGRQRWVRTAGRPVQRDGKVVRIVGAIRDVTDRKVAELRLQHSETLYRTTLESLSEGVVVVGRDGEVVSSNPAALVMLGLEGCSLAGVRLADLPLCFVEQSREQAPLGNLLAEAVQDPARLSNTVAGLNLSGGRGLRWLNLNAVPFASQSGGEGVILSLGDITGTVRQAMTLEIVFQNYPGAVVYFDENLRVAGWNRNFEVLLDVSPEYLASRPTLADYVRMCAERGEYGEGDVERLTRERLDAILTGDVHNYERSRPNGKVLDIRGTILPGGGLLSTFLDITDRKQIERRLIENERIAREKSDELETVLANMNQGVSVFDRDGRLSLWNDNYVYIFERHLRDIRQGVRLEELIEADGTCGDSREDVLRHVTELRRKLAAGETVRSLFRLRSGRVVSTVHAPLPDGGWVGTHEDVTEREAAADQVLHAARHDTLTGLANRTYLNEQIGELFARGGPGPAAPDGAGCLGILMLIDLDRFKPVNDALGHNAGDQLLREVADRLKHCVRDSDLVARVGGDEFAVLLSSAAGMAWPSELAETIARRILTAMSAPFAIEGSDVQIGASIGIAPVLHGASTGELMRNADAALYAVKNEGRNSFRVYHASEESAQAAGQDAAMAHVANARANTGRIAVPELLYQPIVCLRSSELRGYHVVGRRGPDKEASTGGEIGRDARALETSTAALFEKILDAASAWPESHLVALDIGVRQFGLESLPAIVGKAVSRAGVAPSRLHLQVSDGYFLVNAPAALRQLQELQELGVRLVLDRFGTDSSSLRLLGRFRFDSLRIDRIGLEDMLSGERGELVLRSLAGVAETMDVNVWVDGVDSEERVRLLRAAGCVRGTGRLFGLPMPAEALRSVA
jgi:diguanylate cyclase (GGDEF)-like protein/PAS domain S-box-containing protein